MKITVLITVKNAEHTIKNCIDSVLNQTFKNFDVIVIDAYSKDNTYEILKSYGDRIRLFQVEGNAPKAFNYALQFIDSEYVAFTDGDCIVDKNWLKELMKGFKEDVIGVAGFCGTQKTDNKLQYAIGMELENRFKNFPQYIVRAPTMNLCLKTEILKKLWFNEDFKIAFETDLEYRLVPYGRIFYSPKAVVYHYHRASWKSFFFQQRFYGTYAFLTVMKHRHMTLGDHLTNPYMVLQVPIFGIFLLSLLLSG